MEESLVEKPAQISESKTESEYDSAGSYSEGKTSSRRPSETDSEGSVGLERESGDGQESAPARKVDHDEDKKNPQYIPKRGTFYEHDDRTADDDEAAKTIEVEKEKEQKKKVWQDKKERWSHDRFNDSDQAPKSRAELVAIYGYDIRNEEGPPKARRRRRYGRGPNKYTRNWEDEDAYNKPPPSRTKKPPRKANDTGRNNEEFPPLQEHGKREEVVESKVEMEKNGNHEMPPISVAAPSQENLRSQQRVGSGRVVKPNKREIKDSDYRGFTAKTRQVRNMKTEQKIVTKNRKDDFIQSQNFTNKNNDLHELEQDLSRLNVQDGGVYKGKQRQGSMPPRLQSDSKGGSSKRYSSIRQRSLPESATPPFTQQQPHSNFYSNEFNQSGQVIHPSTNPVPQIPPPPLAPIPQVPVTATALPQFAPPFPQAPPPFLQPPPPPFLPQQTPQIINYVPSQPQFTQGYQGYQQQFNPVTQPELYQPATGITYYSTDQQISQRAAPLKRPKAAIPIIAPPPIDFKGKIISKEDDSSNYDSEGASVCDLGGTNIDSSNIQEMGQQQQQQQ